MRQITAKRETIRLNLTNELIAKTGVHYEKTIAVLMDERPGFHAAAAEKIITFLQENGYDVYRITADELMQKTKATLGFFLLIPHAASVPAPCAGVIRDFLAQGGQVITLGGVLFGKWVDRVAGKWQEKPLADNEFDAAYSGKTEPIVIEGVTPSYKTYHYNQAKQFSVAKGQSFVRDAFQTDRALQVVCPVARSRGDGYGCEHKYRYIPLVQINGAGDRDGNNRGAAAFIMLSDTKGHCAVTNGNRPGSVSSTTFGSAIGSIGLTEQDLMSVKGAPQVLLSMLNAMARGLYLFEAGGNQPVYDAGEVPTFGAKILNLSQDFEEVTVRFTVQQKGETVLLREETVLTTPRAYTEISFVWNGYAAGDYFVLTELFHHGTAIDLVQQDIGTYQHVHCRDKNAFIRVAGSEFILNEKPFYSWGMNYWPLYYPSYERTEYWMCWLDKSNYYPNEIEADLALMEKMGINTLYIRLDADVFGRCVPQFKDFIMRCRRHHLYLSLSYPNVTCPLNYSGKAFRKMMALFDLAEDPILFGHDIAWEIGYQLLLDMYRPYWDEGWAAWLEEQYGSVENAEVDFQCRVDRAADGRVIAPPMDEFSNDGDWRVKIAAYRRFIDDYMSRIWNPVVRDIRTVDPNHLIAYRKGPNQPQSVSFTLTNKHIDYTSPEGYSVTDDDYGYHVSCANTMIMNLVSGNKPVVWSEYGLTLTGLRWTELFWDHEQEAPFDYRVEKTTAYIEQYMKMFRRMRVNGSAPWWWCGGFRMVEMSDCGFCGPDGVLRPFGKNYARDGVWFKQQGAPQKADRTVLVDPDANAGGYNFVCEHQLWQENRDAESAGEMICAVTEATGTDTASAPLIAVGNVPFRGSNPPKYFNAEFNTVFLTDENGQKTEIHNGGEVCLAAGEYRLEVSVGNVQEAAWLCGKPGETGAVFLQSDSNCDVALKLPISQKTPYLQDAEITGMLSVKPGTEKQRVSFRMAVENRAVFGQRFAFNILVK